MGKREPYFYVTRSNATCTIYRHCDIFDPIYIADTANSQLAELIVAALNLTDGDAE